VISALLALGGLTAPGPAQGPEDGPTASEEAIRKLWEKHNRDQAFYKMLKGEIKGDKAVATAAAKWFVYRVNWVTNKAESLRMARVMREYEDDMKIYVLPAKNREFQQLFAGQLTKCLQEVLSLNIKDRNDQPAVLHACLMLPSAAKTKHEDLDNLLTGLVNDPKTHEIVKNWALKAMAEFFPVDVVNLLKENVDLKKRDRDIKRVEALMKFVGTKPGNNDKVTADAFRFIRRQAVRALAQTGVPAVEFDKTRSKINAPAVFALLRVLAPAKSKHALDPAATLGERLDAAVGFCHMRFGLEVDPETLYQPEIGLYLVGRHFFPDFVDAYRADEAALRLKAESAELMPYKIEARTFDLALQAFVKNAKNLNVGIKAKEFADYAKPFLDAMVAHNRIPDAADRTRLENMLLPKEGTVFRKTKEPNFLE
jgi:hypothetical protein